MVKDLPAMQDMRRSPGKGNGNPFQYSCLGNPMDRGAWRATVCEVAKNQTGVLWAIAKGSVTVELMLLNCGAGEDF